MKRILFLVFLFAASVLQAAEFEVVDRLTVNGATTLKSSVAVITPDTVPSSLWVSTSAITPHLYVSTNGNVGIGTIFQQSKLDVEGGVAIGATYSGTSAAPSNGLIVEGNVGIGTTEPGNKLSIVGDGADTLKVLRNTIGVVAAPYLLGSFNLQTSGNAPDGQGVKVGFTLEDDTNGKKWLGHIGAVRDTADVEGALVLLAGTNGGEEFVRIDHNGNVGIGTTNPQTALHISGATPFIMVNGTSTSGEPGLSILNA